MLSAWDTRQNKCFIHWEGDSTEIGKDLTDTLMLHPVSNRNGVSYPLSFLWPDVRGWLCSPWICFDREQKVGYLKINHRS